MELSKDFFFLIIFFFFFFFFFFLSNNISTWYTTYQNSMYNLAVIKTIWIKKNLELEICQTKVGIREFQIEFPHLKKKSYFFFWLCYLLSLD